MQRAICASNGPNHLGLYALQAVNGDNREAIVAEGGIPPLISLMQSATVEVQRQSTKAIANLAVRGATRRRFFPEA